MNLFSCPNQVKLVHPILVFTRSFYWYRLCVQSASANQSADQLTSWIDGSNVYGSDPTRAHSLRKNDGSGKLKTSTGRLLPFNLDGLPDAGGTAVDDVDLWVGALAEDSYKGMVGTLIHASLVQQFEALRDGDRFWHELTLSDWDRRQVVKLSQIIKRNTQIGDNMMNNVFIHK